MLQIGFIRGIIITVEAMLKRICIKAIFPLFAVMCIKEKSVMVSKI